MKVLRTLSASAFVLLLFNNLAFGQQWQGPDTTSGAISRSGRVGIGTSPKKSLHISSLLPGSASPRPGTVLRNSTHHLPAINVPSVSYDWDLRSYRNTFTLDYYQNSEFKRSPLSIIGSGNIGIGTTGPTEKLDVTGRIKANDLTMGPWPANPNRYVFFGTNTLDQAAAENYALLQGSAGNEEGRTFLNSSVDIRFRINNSDRMILATNGNVGIGTMGPGVKLDVNDGSLQDGGIRVTTGAADAGLQLSNTGGSNYFIYTTGPGSVNGVGNLAFGRVGLPADIVLSSDGRVGIGGAPTVVNYNAGPPLRPMLDVQGDLRIAHVPVWDGPDGHDLTWGAGSANGVNFNPDKLIVSREGSSRRYKRDIQAFDEDFSKILAVNARQYKMREGYGPPSASNYGYIAEELHDAGLNNLVIYDKKGRPDGIKYKKIVIYVNEVVKAQQKVIEELQAEVAALKRLVAKRSDR